MAKLTKIIKSVALLIALLNLSALHAEILVIVNKTNPLDSISEQDLKNIYLGKTKEFPNGRKAIAINQVYKGKIREHFEKSLLNKTKAALGRYWSKRVFTGKGKPPKEVDDDAEMLNTISSDASAVGYVDAASVNDSVKVIFRIK